MRARRNKPLHLRLQTCKGVHSVYSGFSRTSADNNAVNAVSPLLCSLPVNNEPGDSFQGNAVRDSPRVSVFVGRSGSMRA